MNNRAITLSLIMAVLAIFFVESYVSSIEEETKKRFGTEVLVVSAKRDINEMDTIDETMITLKQIPKRFLEPAAISYDVKEKTPAVVQDMKRFAGSIALVPIKNGEQITFNKLTEPGIRTGLAPQVTPGRRAIAIPVSEVSGVGKLVKPGDRVDLIAVIDLGGNAKGNKMAKMILQDIVVLAVGRNVANNAPRVIEKDTFAQKDRVKSLTEYDGFSSVTLEVEPAQAQKLALIMAESGNAMTLTLRNNEDTERVGLAGMMLNDVLDKDAARMPQQRAPANQGQVQQFKMGK